MDTETRAETARRRARNVYAIIDLLKDAPPFEAVQSCKMAGEAMAMIALGTSRELVLQMMKEEEDGAVKRFGAMTRKTKGPTARRRAAKRSKRLRADRPVYDRVDERDGFKCQACGVYRGQSIHRHHILYLSLGGLTTLDNVVSLCDDCHRAVHAKTIPCPIPC